MFSLKAFIRFCNLLWQNRLLVIQTVTVFIMHETLAIPSNAIHGCKCSLPLILKPFHSHFTWRNFPFIFGLRFDLKKKKKFCFSFSHWHSVNTETPLEVFCHDKNVIEEKKGQLLQTKTMETNQNVLLIFCWCWIGRILFVEVVFIRRLRSHDVDVVFMVQQFSDKMNIKQVFWMVLCDRTFSCSFFFFYREKEKVIICWWGWFVSLLNGFLLSPLAANTKKNSFFLFVCPKNRPLNQWPS